MNHPASGFSAILISSLEQEKEEGEWGEAAAGIQIGRLVDQRGTPLGGRRGGRTTNASTFRLDSHGERRRILSEP